MAEVLHSDYELTSLSLKDVGSLRWMSPEIMEGRFVKTAGSDVYAFGMTIAEVCSNGESLTHTGG